jgi:hypothetical protein
MGKGPNGKLCDHRDSVNQQYSSIVLDKSMLLGQLPCSHPVERHEQHERHGAEEFGIALYVL